MNGSNPYEIKKRQRHPRAKVACLMCRKRRVRCFVSTDGNPCRNCNLGGFLCIFLPSVRKKTCKQPSLLTAENNYTVTISTEGGNVVESHRDDYTNPINIQDGESDASSPASSISNLTTEIDRAILQDTFKSYIAPSPQLIGQKNTPGWFEVADLTTGNENNRREDSHFSLDSLIVGISLFGE